MSEAEIQLHAETELRAALVAVLQTATESPLPAGAVSEIWSHGFCEDGATLVINAVMEDGHDVFISICPGEPISIGVQR